MDDGLANNLGELSLDHCTAEGAINPCTIDYQAQGLSVDKPKFAQLISVVGGRVIECVLPVKTALYQIPEVALQESWHRSWI